MDKKIVITPDVCNGKPIIKGTRVTVQTILEFLAAGDTIQDILEEYPTLTKDDVCACIDYASQLMANHYELERIG